MQELSTLILTPGQLAATSFREFLILRYSYLKARLAGGFSYRDFSRRAGFGSPNYLKLVMDGERNLAPESLHKFMIGLYVSEQDAEFVLGLYLQSVTERATKAMTEAA